MTNDELYEAAEEAIEALFSDTSISKEECATNLRSLIENLRIKISSLGEL